MSTAIQMGLFAEPASPPPPDSPDPSSNSPRDLGPKARLCVLGSGSGGNCTVIQSGSRAILVDAGFTPATTTRRLRAARLDIGAIGALCLTHLDQDHFRPSWINLLLEHRIRLMLHRWHADRLAAVPRIRHLQRKGLIQLLDHEPFCPIEGIRATTVPLPHDQRGTTGYHFETAAGAIGYATDLGTVPTALIEKFTGVDLLAIESNYDPQMQRNSSRPEFLKRRVMGRHGHLSNAQAFEAVRRIADRATRPPRHIVLLHRSGDCNCPRLLQQVFDQDDRIGPRVVLTHQSRPSRWLTVGPLRVGDLLGPKTAQEAVSQLQLGFAGSCP